MRKIITVLLLLFFTANTSFIICQKIENENFAPTVKNGKFVSTLEAINDQFPTGVLSQYWIPDAWHDGGRTLYEFNNDGNITAMNMDSLHNGNWLTEISMTVEYDGNKPVTDIFYFYDIDDGSVMVGTKNVTAYDGEKVDETIQYSWDADVGDWVLSMKQVYEYTNNLITKIADFTWNELTSAWDPYKENVMTYDNQGREIEGLSTTWDSQQSVFVNSGFTTTEYYKDLLVSRMESKPWDDATSDWSTNNYSTTVNQYNNNDKMIESVYTNLTDFGIFVFVLKDSTLYEYDANNYRILATEYMWQDIVGYTLSEKIEYNNDANGNVLDEIHYYYIGQTWVPYRKIIFNYDGTVAVNDIEALPTKFTLDQNYPNPFNPNTKITYSVGNTTNIELKMYDILGNDVATLVDEVQSQGIYSVNFNAEHLSSGTYIYSLRSNNQIITKKCLLIK